MPGIATHFEILRATLDDLSQPASGPMLNQVASVMNAAPAFAHLGVIGPALADFLPSPNPPAGSDPRPNFLSVWTDVLRLFGGQAGLHATLRQIENYMCQLEDLLGDEDFDRLKSFAEGGDFDKLQDLISNFGDIVQFIPDQAKDIAVTIRDSLRPNVCTAAKTDPVPGTDTWQIRDLLHWRKSGAFVKKILDKAHVSGNANHLAYAYGFIIGYAANVCGAPFVNSTVGGPARTQWWRQRMVRNWVDAWVYGYYRASATMPPGTDTPVPDYNEWPNLCDANLQKRIEFGAMDPIALLRKVKVVQPFPDHLLPDDLAQLWTDAFAETYGAQAAAGVVSVSSLNHAYTMTWLMLWFQTSGEVVNWFDCSGGQARPVCTFAQAPQPPDGCTFDPAKVDPFQKDPATGKPILPPKPNVDVASIKSEKKCALITQIIGAIIGFAASAGAGIIVFAVGTVNNEAAVDWKDLRCQLFTIRLYMYNGLQAMHELLAIAGFGYPHAAMLKEDKIAVDALAKGHPWKTGAALVKSKLSDNSFPGKPVPSDETLFKVSFNDEPNASVPGWEKPTTMACSASVYPSFYISDGANPLANGGVRHAPASFPASALPLGSAVANAVDLFRHLDQSFPNWNLDADRGMDYAQWKFRVGTYDPDAVDIVAEP